MKCELTINKGVFFCLFMLAGSAASYGEHFVYTSNTGGNMTVLIKKSIAPPLEKNDEIGAFVNGRCVGGITWEGKNAAITVWGDNEQTKDIDGAQTGGKLEFKIWRNKENKEYKTEVYYEKGKPFYTADGIVILSGMKRLGREEEINSAVEDKKEDGIEKSDNKKNVLNKEINDNFVKEDTNPAEPDKSLSAGINYAKSGDNSAPVMSAISQEKAIAKQDNFQIIPLSPLDSALLYADSIVLSWSFKTKTKKMSTTYTELADNRFMNNPIIDSTDRPADTIKIMRSLTEGTYWWLVRTILDDGEELKSPTSSFTISHVLNQVSISPSSFIISWQPADVQRKRYALSFILSKSSLVNFKIANSSGKTVHRRKETMQAGSNTIDVSIDTLSRGTYTYVLETEDYSIHGKFKVEK